MPDTIPALPPGFKIDAIPDLPPGFKLDAQTAVPNAGASGKSEDPGFFSTLGKYAKSAGQSLIHPIDAAKSIGQSHIDSFHKTVEDFRKGDYMKGVSQGAATAIPAVGPFAANVMESIEQDRPGEAAAGLLTLGAPHVAGPIARGAAKSAGVVGSTAETIARLPGVRKLPIVDSALDVLDSIRGKNPGMGRADMALQLYKETHEGKLPKTVQEKVQALNTYDQLKEQLTAKKIKAKAVKPPPLRGSSLQDRIAAEREANPGKPAVKPPPLRGSSLQDRIAAEREANPGKPAVKPPPLRWPPKAVSQEEEVGAETAQAASPASPTRTTIARYSEAEGNPSKLTSRELNPGKVINAQAGAKNIALAQRFKGLGMDAKTIRGMTEAEFNQHRIAENAVRKQQGKPLMDPIRPGPGRRTFAELKADIVAAMESLP